KTPKEWSFTKYDALNRPVLTGIYQDNESLTQGTLQQGVNDFYAAATTNTNEWFESRGGAVHGYTNVSFPHVANEGQYLTITYYDDESYKPLIKTISNATDTRFNYKSDEFASGQYEYDGDHTNFPRLKGLVTATKTKVLDE